MSLLYIKIGTSPQNSAKDDQSIASDIKRGIVDGQSPISFAEAFNTHRLFFRAKCRGGDVLPSSIHESVVTYLNNLIKQHIRSADGDKVPRALLRYTCIEKSYATSEYVLAPHFTSNFWHPETRESSVFVKNSDGISEQQILKGKLAKRFRKLLHIQGWKIDDKALADMGEFFSRIVPTTTESVVFSFTQKLTWRDGDFGDSGSCYWGGYSHARTDVIPANDGGAILFWNSDEFDAAVKELGEEKLLGMKRQELLQNVSGIGRAWILPCDSLPYVDDDESAGNHLIFNLYSRSHNVRKETLPSLLADTFDTPCQKISLESSANETGAIYLNGDGYAIGWNPSYCINFDMEGADDFGKTCDNCGCHINDDQSFYVEGHGEFCEDCYCDRFSTCECCSESCENDEMAEVETGRDYPEYWCEHCRDRRATLCSDCGTYHSDSNSPCTEIYNTGEYVCSNCLESGDYSVCDECADWHTADYVQNVVTANDGELCLCEDCAPDARDCECCGDFCASDNLVEMTKAQGATHDGDIYCLNCATDCESDAWDNQPQLFDNPRDTDAIRDRLAERTLAATS